MGDVSGHGVGPGLLMAFTHAIVRALAHDPLLVLADEPTGNLDDAAARTVLALLRALHRRFGQTLVLVTHDAGVAARAARQRATGARLAVLCEKLAMTTGAALTPNGSAA